MLYTLTRPPTRDPIGLEVWMRIGAECSTLNEGWLRFEPVTSYHVGSDTMLKNQLNQKLKLMAESPGYVVYSNKNIIYNVEPKDNIN